MSEVKTHRLASAAKELNVGTSTIVDHLHAKGFKDVANSPNTKLTEEQYEILLREFRSDMVAKEKAEAINIGKRKEEEISIKEAIKETAKVEKEKEEIIAVKHEVEGPKIVGKIDLDKPKKKKEAEVKPAVEPVVEKTTEKTEPIVEVKEEKEQPEEKAQQEEKKIEPVEEVKKEEVKPVEEEFIRTKTGVLSGPKILGKIELPIKQERRPEDIFRDEEKAKREKEREKQREGRDANQKRARITQNKVDIKKFEPSTKDTRPSKTIGAKFDNKRGKPVESKDGISEKDIQDKIRSTMAKLQGTKTKSDRSKYRKSKREDHAARTEGDDAQDHILQLTEFITVSELAGLMDVTPTQVISSCMGLGVFVSINQRLDAEVIELVAGEFGFEAQFINLADEEDEDEEDIDAPEDLKKRPPIVTIMGHVDHGKTSLLDYIRSANVVAGEMGGITQHIGAYEVETTNGEHITFLDTPGHEAFTAMRARGAKLTDIAVIVIAADDAIMPQTREAISHAQAAEVPMIFAINKMDKEGANPDNIRNQLSQMNILVEEWGGKFQCQEISAKKGINIDKLLDKIVLEAEMLDLKANPNKLAVGSVIEAQLDKGRGYVSTIMVQEGTLEIGDFVVAGQYYGKVKAMTNERGVRIVKAGPSSPVQVLGLLGAPTAGDKIKVYADENEGKETANRRATIIREQGMRAKKHITLDEIGRRLALGNFKELNLIIKGDVDGSVEALADSLLKLSTEEIQVNVIHKGVGAISESDVLLASASDAIICAFQVRPSMNAKALAEKEDIQIKYYNIIYDAIEEIKAAMEGLLEPKFEEKIVGNIEIREVFKVSKVGTIAGCYVLDGRVARSNKIRIIRDGIVVHSGELDSLKRFKDDVKDVTKGYECGLKIKNYNDIQVNDIVEAFEQVEVKRKL
ncbi:MAG TPA: translation initiation factor IF-2 [Chitinophagales bacterium]|nr:translation initiation factor IF-2 [Chitinophagales bacterium]HNC72085.1 translation initiation factor IF-2 [Chitinophagales bacterium]HNF51573.1 translation initiation factor IF-2 [Chitinophagales bacterium]